MKIMKVLINFVVIVISFVIVVGLVTTIMGDGKILKTIEGIPLSQVEVGEPKIVKELITGRSDVQAWYEYPDTCVVAGYPLSVGYHKYHLKTTADYVLDINTMQMHTTFGRPSIRYIGYTKPIFHLCDEQKDRHKMELYARKHIEDYAIQACFDDVQLKAKGITITPDSVVVTKTKHYD
jgi:hypothetical protein